MGKKQYISIPGCLWGYKTSCLVIGLNFKNNYKKNLLFIDKYFREVLLTVNPLNSELLSREVDSGDVSVYLIYWSFLCLRFANFPLTEIGRVIDGGKARHIVIPSSFLTHSLIFRAIEWMLRLIAAEDLPKTREEIALKLPALVKQLKGISRYGSNVPHFLSAAMKLNIPVDVFCASVFQLGHGKFSRWLDSSFTDTTPYLSTNIARNKDLSAHALREAGFPVASHAVAKSSDDALRIADQIGYPVVIKPANRDGGLGVAANLKNREQVIQAYADACKYSTKVLVEKHIYGRDYRLTVYNGELISAIERVPGGVIGNGKNTVDELLALLNADPRRGDGPDAILKKIPVDGEAVNLLKEYGMTLKSVPKINEFVPLRRRANVSSGGMPVTVLQAVHSDNRRLAIRVAASLKLDLAGIDFITSDIARSWMDVGGTICEVNAQPQLGSITFPHIYSEILQSFIIGNGRIPISLVFGAADESIAKSLALTYAQQGMTVGYAGRSGVFVADECVGKKRMNLMQAGKALTRDRNVDAIIIEVNDFSVLRTGLPFDRFDKMIIAGLNFRGEKEGAPIIPEKGASLLKFALEALRPACSNVINLIGSS